MMRALGVAGSVVKSRGAWFGSLVLVTACGGEVGTLPGSGSGAAAGSGQSQGGAAGAGAASAGGGPTMGGTGGGATNHDAPLTCVPNVEVPEANRDECPDSMICAQAALLVFPYDVCGGAPLGYWRVTLDGAGMVLWVEGEGISTDVLICARLTLGNQQFRCLKDGAVWQDV